jgi:predicted small lipoprotein YifL
MKKIFVALVATLVAVSMAGCVGLGKGKGKAPPPIVTKG